MSERLRSKKSRLAFAELKGNIMAEFLLPTLGETATSGGEEGAHLMVASSATR